MTISAMNGWDQDLVKVGERQLLTLAPLVDAADPDRLVAPRNRMLCAGLARLSTLGYEALGGQRRHAEVERAGALLSLLTKVDDQVIDAPAFHAPAGDDRAELEARTLAYLAPTLRSLRLGQPTANEGRCHLAAELGRALRAIAHDTARLRLVLDDIALGWRIQARAVALLSAPAGAIARPSIERITTAISAVWLRMMIRLGELPGDARRSLTPSELTCLRRWGAWIQRADALADLAKDTADGLVSSLPGLRLWEHDPLGYERACASRDAPWLYAHLAALHIDRELTPTDDQLDALAPASLGRLPSLLRFIHGFLHGRYLATQSGALPSSSHPALFGPESLPRLTREDTCSAP